MKTKLCRPILVETNKDNPQIGDICINSIGLFIWDKEHAQYDVKNTLSEFRSTKVYELILISLDPNEKIEVDDFYIAFGNAGTFLLQCKEACNGFLVSTDQYKYPFDTYKCKKVVVRQSQLPEEYIQRFVEEYNSGNVKDVEIEMEGILPPVGGQTCGGGAVVYFIGYKPKLTNGFVTIVDNKEPILYTEEDMISLLNTYEQTLNNGYQEEWYDTDRKIFKINKEGFLEWLQENKKK